jgi:hypothetical protein
MIRHAAIRCDVAGLLVGGRATSSAGAPARLATQLRRQDEDRHDTNVMKQSLRHGLPAPRRQGMQGISFPDQARS